MKKRNDNFTLSSEEAVNEFMKYYDSDSHRHHRSSHGHCDNSSKHGHTQHKKKKPPFALRVLIIVVLIIFLIVSLFSVTVLIMHNRGKEEIDKKKENVTLQTADDAVAYDDSGKTVEYKGKKYVYNEDIITVAFLGIDDKRDRVMYSSEYGVAGQADTIMVLAYDTRANEVSVIAIPRDSVIDVDIYSANGNFVKTKRMQICLSFAYGDGGNSSCENVIKSIERVLLGIPIDSYFSLRVKGIDALNDAVGGIELTSLETIRQFVKGEKVKLIGSQARSYVTARDTSKTDSDSLRRERQIQYIKAFASKTMSLARKNIGIVTTLYNTAKAYSVTDITLSRAVYISGEFVRNSAKIGKVTSLKGNYVETESYPQFILDNESVYETILDIFYESVN